VPLNVIIGEDQNEPDVFAENIVSQRSPYAVCLNHTQIDILDVQTEEFIDPVKYSLVVFARIEPELPLSKVKAFTIVELYLFLVKSVQTVPVVG
jgi:hypothetical protein